MSAQGCPVCGWRMGHAPDCPIRREHAIARLIGLEGAMYVIAIFGWLGLIVALVIRSRA